LQKYIQHIKALYSDYLNSDKQIPANWIIYLDDIKSGLELLMPFVPCTIQVIISELLIAIDFFEYFN
jgi:hypothetical protein